MGEQYYDIVMVASFGSSVWEWLVNVSRSFCTPLVDRSQISNELNFVTSLYYIRIASSSYARSIACSEVCDSLDARTILN